MMARACCAALLVAAGLSSASIAQTGERSETLPIAHFSYRRAFAESDEGKAGEAKLSALRNAKTNQIDVRNTRLKALEKELETSANLDADARREREHEIRRLEVELERLLDDARAEVAAVENELQKAFRTKARSVVEQVARERGLRLVLDRDAGVAVVIDETHDITAEVVARLNRPRVKR